MRLKKKRKQGKGRDGKRRGKEEICGTLMTFGAVTLTPCTLLTCVLLMWNCAGDECGSDCEFSSWLSGD